MVAEKKTHWLRNTVIVLLICGTVGMILSAVLFLFKPTRTYAYAYLQLSFDGAADAKAPNGYTFDIRGIYSDDVLNNAIDSVMENNKYTLNQIRDNLVVTGVFPDNIVQQVMSYDSLMNFTANRELTISSFHPTLFGVRLYNDFDKSIPQQKLETLLKAILEEFRVYFVQRYGVVLNEINLFDLSSYDYIQRLEIVEKMIAVESDYAQEMYIKDPQFSINGKGFNDIYVQLDNLTSADIAKLNAEITMNALTTNTARLAMQYQFEILDLSIQLEKEKNHLTRVEELISSYNKNEIIYLSTADALTKIDGNSSETYDKLVESRKLIDDGITSISSQIVSYQLKLADLLHTDDEQEESKTSQIVSDSPISETDSAIYGTNGTADDSAMNDEAADIIEIDESVQEMTEKDIQIAAKAAEEAAIKQMELLEKSFSTLIEKLDSITADFQTMLKAYTDQELNEVTISFTRFGYEAPSLFSGSFIRQTIKVAGPICALGFVICVILIIRSRRKVDPN